LVKVVNIYFSEWQGCYVSIFNNTTLIQDRLIIDCACSYQRIIAKHVSNVIESTIFGSQKKKGSHHLIPERTKKICLEEGKESTSSLESSSQSS